ncbi:MAG: hypothetical protein ACRDXE_11290 [Acidimicrobiales bacterium]
MSHGEVLVDLYVEGRKTVAERVRRDDRDQMGKAGVAAARAEQAGVRFLLVLSDPSGEELPFFHGNDRDLADRLAHEAGGKLPETIVSRRVTHHPSL